LVFADAAHLGAQVGRRQVDRDAVWLEQSHESVDDLHAHALLHREPAAKTRTNRVSFEMPMISSCGT